MSQEFVAYLIGGPFDLTKRTLSNCPPRLLMAEVPRMVDMGYCPSEPLDSVECKVHVYHRVGCVTDSDGSGRKVEIFNYEGERG